MQQRLKYEIGPFGFGYSSSIPFPNGTKVVFEACAGHNNRYELVRVAEATLGADCDISNIGHVKNGQTIFFWSGALDCVNMEGHSVN